MISSSLELQFPLTASIGMFELGSHYLQYPRAQSRLHALSDASLNLVLSNQLISSLSLSLSHIDLYRKTKDKTAVSLSILTHLNCRKPSRKKYG